MSLRRLEIPCPFASWLEAPVAYNMSDDFKAWSGTVYSGHAATAF